MHTLLALGVKDLIFIQRTHQWVKVVIKRNTEGKVVNNFCEFNTPL